MCEKQRYDSQREAMEQVVSLKKHRRDRHTYRPYPCPQCGGYHVATVSKVLRPAKKEKYPINYRYL